MEAFIHIMHNKTVQERMCTELKVQPQALRLSKAFEEGINQQKSFWGNTDIKNKPVYAIENRNKNPCTKCGLEFVTNQTAVCKAKNEKCRNCGITGHFQRLCKRPETAHLRGIGRRSNRGGMRRNNSISQTIDQSEESSEWDEFRMGREWECSLATERNGCPTVCAKVPNE